MPLRDTTDPESSAFRSREKVEAHIVVLCDPDGWVRAVGRAQETDMDWTPDLIAEWLVKAATNAVQPDEGEEPTTLHAELDALCERYWRQEDDE